MKKQYVKIYLCGDCIQYNWKKHKCNLGAHEEGKPSDSFYQDCPLGLHEENEILPSAEPERQWIPVTEELPKDMDRLLATIVRPDGEKRVRSGHLKKYEEAEKGRASVIGKRLNENVAVLPDGVYCNVCGTRLDLDEVSDES